MCQWRTSSYVDGDVSAVQNPVSFYFLSKRLTIDYSVQFQKQEWFLLVRFYVYLFIYLSRQAQTDCAHRLPNKHTCAHTRHLSSCFSSPEGAWIKQELGDLERSSERRVAYRRISLQQRRRCVSCHSLCPWTCRILDGDCCWEYTLFFTNLSVQTCRQADTLRHTRAQVHLHSQYSSHAATLMQTATEKKKLINKNAAWYKL